MYRAPCRSAGNRGLHGARHTAYRRAPRGHRQAAGGRNYREKGEIHRGEHSQTATNCWFLRCQAVDLGACTTDMRVHTDEARCMRTRRTSSPEAAPVNPRITTHTRASREQSEGLQLSLLRAASESSATRSAASRERAYSQNASENDDTLDGSPYTRLDQSCGASQSQARSPRREDGGMKSTTSAAVQVAVRAGRHPQSRRRVDVDGRGRPSFGGG